MHVCTLNVQRSTDYCGKSTWSATLPGTASSMTQTYTIKASSKLAQATIALTGVLFGDVWFCAGQSNMDYTVGGAVNSSAEEADMLNYDSIRLFQEGHWNTTGTNGHPVQPHTPQAEMVYPSVTNPEAGVYANWSTPCPNITDAELARYYNVVPGPAEPWSDLGAGTSGTETAENQSGDTDGGGGGGGGGSSGTLTMQDCDYSSLTQQWTLSPGATFNNSAITSILNMGSGGSSSTIDTTTMHPDSCPKGAPLSVAGCKGPAVVAGPTYECKKLPTANCSAARKCDCNAAWEARADGTIVSVMDGGCLVTSPVPAPAPPGLQMTVAMGTCGNSNSKYTATPIPSSPNGSYFTVEQGGACLAWTQAGPNPPPSPPSPPPNPAAKYCRAKFSAACWFYGI